MTIAPTAPRTTPAWLRETFLSNYFLADILFAEHLGRDKMHTLYNRYAALFCIKDSKWTGRMWNTLSSDLLAGADTPADFNRLLRLCEQYPAYISPDEAYLLAQKAPAMKIKDELFGDTEQTTAEGVLSLVEKHADGGDTDCLALLAFLEYNGALFRPQRKNALHHARRAAAWNHTFAALMVWRYTKNPHAAAVLYSTLQSAAGAAVWDYLKDCLDLPTDIQKDPIVTALSRAFCAGSLTPNKIHPDVMKVMNSTVLSEECKVRIIRAAGERACACSDIPMNITKGEELNGNLRLFAGTGAPRQEEFDRVYANLSLLDMRDTGVYKPLLIVCPDKTVLDLYRRRLLACFAAAPHTVLSLQETPYPDLSATKDNLFIEAANRLGTRNAVLVIEGCDTLSGETAEAFARYLSPTFRRHIRLTGPNMAEVDMTGLLPVLLATSMPAKAIGQACDIIVAKESQVAENADLLTETLQEKKTLFRLSSLSMEETVPAFLFDYSADTVSRLLDAGIARLRQGGRDVHITVALLQDIIKGRMAYDNKLGFWKEVPYESA